MRRMQRFRTVLARRKDASSLAFFRISFGIILACEALTLLWPRNGLTHLEFLYTSNSWNVPYPFFEWVKAWPEPWMTLHVVVLALAGLAMALGLVYRLSAIVGFVAWTYLFLIDDVLYNNHYYLIALVAFLLIWMPADRVWSVDAWWRGRRSESASPALVPFWTIFLLRGQMFCVYFFGGVAKLSESYLVAGEPLRSVLSDSPQAVVLGLAWAGLVYDFLIGFLLCLRRTRVFALVWTILFHAINHFVIFDDIGWFPLLGVAATTIFLAPDWPRAVLRRLVRQGTPGTPVGREAAPIPQWGLALLGAWLAAQAALPLRHYLIPGNVNWTGEGTRFSWRMKAAARVPGKLQIRLRDDALFPEDAEGRIRLQPEEWRGGRRVFREIDGSDVDWTAMPPVFVFFEPGYGERVVFNPYGDGTESPLTAEASRSRARTFWRRLYGREPMINPIRPFAADGPFSSLFDPELVREERGIVWLDRDRWKAAWPTAHVVFLDEARLAERDWVDLPGSFLFEGSDGVPWVRINATADLHPYLRTRIQIMPYRLHQYVRRLAGEWMKAYGRRPQIYVSSEVRLKPYPMQPNVDPSVDLVAAPIRWFGRNEWILPLRKEAEGQPSIE